MLVIHPDECIDCGVCCEPECPVDAIKPDTEPGVEKVAKHQHGNTRSYGLILRSRRNLRPTPKNGSGCQTRSNISHQILAKAPASKAGAYASAYSELAEGRFFICALPISATQLAIASMPNNANNGATAEV